MVTFYLVFLGMVGLERLFEVALSRRHAVWALERGGREFRAERFVIMKVLQTAFLVSSAAEVVLLGRPFVPLLGYPMMGLAVAAMALRYWAVLSLGSYWNVRVIVVPGTVMRVNAP